MLLAQKPDRHFPALGIDERDTEQPLAQEDSLGVVPERPMTDVREERL